MTLGGWERLQGLPEVGLRGTGLHPFSTSECVDFILDELDAGRGGWLVPVDLNVLLTADGDAEYRELCDEATLRVPSARVLAWACRLQRTPLPEAVAPVSLLLDLSTQAARVGRRAYVIAADEETPEHVRTVLAERVPDLELLGCLHVDDAAANEDPIVLASIARTLLQAAPDLVYVGLEPPVQERLIAFLRKDLADAWWIGTHFGLERLAGLAPDAPDWMRKGTAHWRRRLGRGPGELLARTFLREPLHAGGLLVSSAFRGILPKGKTESRYGRRKPRALLVDDDEHALAHLELLLSSRFPEIEILTRSTPDISGVFDFYFLDNDFEGERLAARLAGQIREERPGAMVFAFSGVLDIGTLKSLINAGCDGVCDKSDPKSWRPILERMARHLEAIAQRHAINRQSFGGVRGSAHSIQRLLHEWNEAPGDETLERSKEASEA